jgi:hypothetical protein
VNFVCARESARQNDDKGKGMQAAEVPRIVGWACKKFGGLLPKNN